ncbi:hypothetical protein [Streptosporangium sp. NPDC051022]|uniref:hypothetical protein n=1 Tax=Streptosporangium sp. NPDC051022 TaxID=3155752 RepID=UPI003412CA83
MDSRVEQVRDVLREVAETHHQVYRIVNGADADWASWYADWLINLSELPNLLETTPVRSELVYELVGLHREYTATAPAEDWESFYARRLLAAFRPETARPAMPAPF